MNNNGLTEEELNNMSEDQLLDLYVEQMLKDKGLDNLEGELRQQVHDDLKEKLTFEVNRAILSAMPEDKFEELNAKVEAGEANADMIAQAVQESGIDVDSITEAAMKDFRRVFLEGDKNEVSAKEPAVENAEA